MKTRLAMRLMLIAAVALSCTALRADITYTPVTHAQLQAVTSNGSTAFDTGGVLYPVSLTGVVINNPGHMSNYLPFVYNTSWWQTYVQALPEAVAAGDFGGSALYMRVNNPMNSGTLKYDETTWGEAMDDLNKPMFDGTKVTDPLRYGDKILIEANAPGLFFGGKYNINEQHNADPAYNFTITILERNLTPYAAPLTLADLKSTAAGSFDQFLFDATRAAGCEHYQGSLVHLENLRMISGTWAPDGTVTVEQTVDVDGSPVTLTFPLKLGLDGDLFTDSEVLAAVNGGTFDITAILDQETPRTGPFTGGYRLWLTERFNFSPVPEPSSLILLVAAMLGLGWHWRRKRM